MGRSLTLTLRNLAMWLQDVAIGWKPTGCPLDAKSQNIVCNHEMCLLLRYVWFSYIHLPPRLIFHHLLSMKQRLLLCGLHCIWNHREMHLAIVSGAIVAYIIVCTWLCILHAAGQRLQCVLAARGRCVNGATKRLIMWVRTAGHVDMPDLLMGLTLVSRVWSAFASDCATSRLQCNGRESWLAVFQRHLPKESRPERGCRGGRSSLWKETCQGARLCSHSS